MSARHNPNGPVAMDMSATSSRTGGEVNDLEVDLYGSYGDQNGHGRSWGGQGLRTDESSISKPLNGFHSGEAPVLPQAPMELVESSSLSTPHLDNLISFWMKEASDVRAQPWMRTESTEDDITDNEQPLAEDSMTPGLAAAQTRAALSTTLPLPEQNMGPARLADEDERENDNSSANGLPVDPCKKETPSGEVGGEENNTGEQQEEQSSSDGRAVRTGPPAAPAAACPTSVRHATMNEEPESKATGGEDPALPRAGGRTDDARTMEKACELLQGKAEQAEELGRLLLRVSKLQRSLLEPAAAVSQSKDSDRAEATEPKPPVPPRMPSALTSDSNHSDRAGLGVAFADEPTELPQPRYMFSRAATSPEHRYVAGEDEDEDEDQSAAEAAAAEAPVQPERAAASRGSAERVRRPGSPPRSADVPPGAIHSTSSRRRNSIVDDSGNGGRRGSVEEGWGGRRGSGAKRRGSVRCLGGSGLYPFMEAQYTLQRDILDDGRPPLPRMEVPERMMDMVMLVKDVSTLPKPAEGRSSFYCLEASFDQEIYKTQVKKGDEDFGCAWYERFEISIHELTLELAKTAMDTGTEGPALTFVCYECGKYASNEMVGKGIIFLKDILELPPEGGDVWTEMLDVDLAPVSGNGEISTLMVHFRLRSNAVQGKEIPTLAEVLGRSEGDIALSKAQAKNDSFYEMKPRSRIGSLVSEESYFDAEDDHLTLTGSHTEHSHINYYWRERLEQRMGSLTVNFIIICCVLADLINLFVILAHGDSSDGQLPSTIITLVVQCVFMTELTLRIIASGHRFWKSWWNVFDFVVIWVSVIMVVTKFIIDDLGTSVWTDSDFETANGTTNTLRVISRVAIGMRVIKVLINLRRARNLRGHVRQTIRTTVSQNKRRYKKHGFDLDLTYITNRVIAMAAPAFGGHSAYRNDIHVVSRFLSYMHYGHFLVFNLCDVFHSGDRMMGSYHHKLLFSSVQRIPFEDHGPPLLGEMVYFCRQAEVWLRRDPKNVIAVHCKGGKGRSGLMIAAYLLWSGHRRCALDALELFTFRRTQNYDPDLGVDGTYNNLFSTEKCNQTVEGPSQIRYVHYLEAVLYCGISPTAQDKMHILDMSFPIGPMLARKPWMVSFTIRCNRACVFDSSKHDTQQWRLGGEVGSTSIFNLDLVVWGDVRIECYEHKRRWGRVKGKLKFFVVFNTAFYRNQTSLTFGKSKIDMLHKDRKLNRRCEANFSMTLSVSDDARSSDLMQLEQTFRDIFSRCGTRHSYRRGDVVLPENATNHTIYLITSGTVEGVVLEVPSMPAHMLGKYICERKDEEEAAVNSTTIRCPSVAVLGPHTVLGYSSFLSNKTNMLFRAQTDVEVVCLRKVEKEVPSENGVSKRRRVSLTGAGIGDIEIAGLEHTDLASFYRGLAVTLATRLSQVRKEMIRIGDLKGFSDSQGALIEHNLSEQLRVSCIQTFALPMNEQVTFTIKCLCQMPLGRVQKMRLIVLTEYIILDPLFYGPEVAANSEVLDVRQLRSVAPSEETKPTTINVTVLGPSVHGLDIAANVVNYTLTFVEPAQSMQVYHVVSTMCKKAEETRTQERFRPFETPFMTPLLENCSVAHHLKKGELLNLASNEAGASLFFIRSGEVKLRTSGRAMGGTAGGVFRLVRQGACFGETEFALQLKHGHTWAEASEATVVLEMRQEKVHELIHNDTIMSARFYSTLCQVIEKQLRIALGNAFPGTWNRKMETDYTRGTQMVNPGTRKWRQSMDSRSRASVDRRGDPDDSRRGMGPSTGSWSGKGRLAQAAKQLMRSKSLFNGRAGSTARQRRAEEPGSTGTDSGKLPRTPRDSPASSMLSSSPATGSTNWPWLNILRPGRLVEEHNLPESALDRSERSSAVADGEAGSVAASSRRGSDLEGGGRITNWNGRRTLAQPPTSASMKHLGSSAVD